MKYTRTVRGCLFSRIISSLSFPGKWSKWNEEMDGTVPNEVVELNSEDGLPTGSSSIVPQGSYSIFLVGNGHQLCETGESREIFFYPCALRNTNVHFSPIFIQSSCQLCIRVSAREENLCKYFGTSIVSHASTFFSILWSLRIKGECNKYCSISVLQYQVGSL